MQGIEDIEEILHLGFTSLAVIQSNERHTKKRVKMNAWYKASSCGKK
jgi:hypothetical protein